MRSYRITFTIGFSYCYNWNNIKIGALAIERKIPMLKSEYETFKEMEKMNIEKNIEPGKIFQIFN